MHRKWKNGNASQKILLMALQKLEKSLIICLKRSSNYFNGF